MKQTAAKLISLVDLEVKIKNLFVTKKKIYFNEK